MSIFKDSGYISTRENYTEWWKKDANLPVLDRQQIAYAWIITPLQILEDWGPLNLAQYGYSDVHHMINSLTPATAFYTPEEVESFWLESPVIGSPFTPSYNEGNIVYSSTVPKTENLTHFVDYAVTKLLTFFNKEDDASYHNITYPTGDFPRDWIRPILLANARVHMVHFGTGGEQNFYLYCTVDAKLFDNSPPKGVYTIQTVPDATYEVNGLEVAARVTLHTIAEDLRPFFKVTNNTEMGVRSRISEILKANGIQVSEITSSAGVREWISKINEPWFVPVESPYQYGVGGDPLISPEELDISIQLPPDCYFLPQARIYLPHPDRRYADYQMPPGGFHVSLGVSEILPQIAHLKELLDVYKTQIYESPMRVLSLDIPWQKQLLDKFEPALRQHLAFNNIEKKNILDNTLDIFFDSQYKIDAMFLDVNQEKIALDQGISGLPLIPPFDNPRTMNFILNLYEISGISIPYVYVDEVETPMPSMGWLEFLGHNPDVADGGYIFPPVQVRNKDSGDPLDALDQQSVSIAQQLANKYNRSGWKTDFTLDEENASIGDPAIANAVTSQAASETTFVGDSVIANLANIQSRIAGAGGGQAAIASAYSLILNKLSIDVLMAAAAKCLMAQIPFGCSDMINAIVAVDVSTAANFFKHVLPPEQHVHVNAAQTAALDSPANPELFLETLQAQIEQHNETGAGPKIEYDEIVEDVCSYLTDFLTSPEKLFHIPVMFFDDMLPTVDIMRSITTMLESAIFEMISSLIMGLVTGLIDVILDSCNEVVDVFPDNDFGNADIAGAIASNVGNDNLSSALTSFFDMVTGEIEVPPLEEESAPGEGEGETPVECPEGSYWDPDALGPGQGSCVEERWIDLDPIVTLQEPTYTTTIEIGGQGESIVASDLLVEQLNVIKELLAFIGNLVNVNELMSLFTEEGAPPHVYSSLRWAINTEFPNLSLDLNTDAKLKIFFNLLRPLVDVNKLWGTLEQTTVRRPGEPVEGVMINGVLTCNYDTFCQKVYNLRIKWPDVNIDLTPHIQEAIETRQKQLAKFFIDFEKTGDTETPLETFCQEGMGLTGLSLIPKDNHAVIFLLEKVVDTMYDATYMAYDQEIMNLGDALYVAHKIAYPVTRITNKCDQRHSIFNLTSMRREEFQISARPEGYVEDIAKECLVVNPEFQRLLSTGFVPTLGDREGQYGPYTTMKGRSRMQHDTWQTIAVAAGGTIGAFSPAGPVGAIAGAGLGMAAVELADWLGWMKTDIVAPPVRAEKTIPEFASQSVVGLIKLIDLDIMPQFNRNLPEKVCTLLDVSIDQPPPLLVQARASLRGSSFVMKLTLTPTIEPDFGGSTDSLNMSEMTIYENAFVLRIGDIPIDATVLTMSPGFMEGGGEMPGITQDISDVIFRDRYFGTSHVPTNAGLLITQIEQARGRQLTLEGQNPQMDVLVEFVRSVFEKAGWTMESQPLGFGGTTLLEYSDAPHNDIDGERQSRNFVQWRMYDDMERQIMGIFGREILMSPLFLKSEGGYGASQTGISYVKLVDWAPIPTREERKCGYDPHILSLDTFKKRIIEEYKQLIECAPLEDEISTDGLGRDNLSALERASMTGCVMTTIRAYALEQLVRSMFPLSVFVGTDVVTSLFVEFITEETLKLILAKSEKYYEEFLNQVEIAFDARMQPFSPYGQVEDIVARTEAMGLDWIYADSAIKEWQGIPTGNEFNEEEVLDSATPEGIGEIECEAPSEDPVSAPSFITEKREQVRNRLRFLVEEQLYSVLVKLQDLICFNNTLSFHDNLLARQLPLLHVQSEPGENRFAKHGLDVINAEQDMVVAQLAEYQTQFAQWKDTQLIERLDKLTGATTDVLDGWGAGFGCFGELFDIGAPINALINNPDLDFWEWRDDQEAQQVFEDIQSHDNIYNLENLIFDGHMGYGITIFTAGGDGGIGALAGWLSNIATQPTNQWMSDNQGNGRDRGDYMEDTYGVGLGTALNVFYEAVNDLDNSIEDAFDRWVAQLDQGITDFGEWYDDTGSAWAVAIDVALNALNLAGTALSFLWNVTFGLVDDWAWDWENISLDGAGLTELLYSIIGGTLGFFQDWNEMQQDVSLAAAQYGDPRKILETFTAMGGCFEDVGEGYHAAAVKILESITDAPLPVSHFATGLAVGTRSTFENVSHFDKRLHETDGIHSNQNAIPSQLTDTTGMLMLEKYIRVSKTQFIETQIDDTSLIAGDAQENMDSDSSSTTLPGNDDLNPDNDWIADYDTDNDAGDFGGSQASSDSTSDAYVDGGEIVAGNLLDDELNAQTNEALMPGYGGDIDDSQTPGTPDDTFANVSDMNNDGVVDVLDVIAAANNPVQNIANLANQVMGNSVYGSSQGPVPEDTSPFGNVKDMGESLGQILAPREAINTSNRSNNPARDKGSTLLGGAEHQRMMGSVARKSLIPEVDPQLEEIWNIDTWQERLEEIMSAHPDAKFEDLFRGWSFGTRLVYIAAPSDWKEVNKEDQVGSTWQTQIPGAASDIQSGKSQTPFEVPKYPLPMTNPPDYKTVGFRFSRAVSAASKAYQTFERVTAHKKVREVNPDDPGIGYRFYDPDQAVQEDGYIRQEEMDLMAAAVADFESSDGFIASWEQFFDSVNRINAIDNRMVGTTILKEFVDWDRQDVQSTFSDQFLATLEDQELERVVPIIPISEIEIPIEIPKETKMSDMFTWDALSIDTTQRHGYQGPAGMFQDLNDLYTRRFMSQTLHLMKTSPGYELALKYCVPSDTLLSYSTIYSNLLNEMPDTFFDETKFELKNLFEILLNGGDFTFEGPTEVEKGSNREQMANAKSNVGTDGNSRKPTLYDMAIQTPKLIFKGLTEFMDPVIAPASQIVKAAKAGKLYPRMLKVTDMPGHPSEAWPGDTTPTNPDYEMQLEDDQGEVDPNAATTSEWWRMKIELNRWDIGPPLGSVSRVPPIPNRYSRHGYFGPRYEEGSSGGEGTYVNDVDDHWIRMNEEGELEHDNSEDEWSGFPLLDFLPGAGLGHKLGFDDYNVLVGAFDENDMGNVDTSFVPGEPTNVRTSIPIPIIQDKATEQVATAFFREYFLPLRNQAITTKGFKAYYAFAKACASRNFGAALNVFTVEYMKAMTNSEIRCADFMLKKNGKLFVPAFTLITPGEPLDIPITPVAMSLLPMDMTMGFGQWPPHSPLGLIYHALEQSESLSFPSSLEKRRLRIRVGLENKKKPDCELCIDVDQLRDEDVSRERENEALAKQTRISLSTDPGAGKKC